jgi:putative ABC transport system ATP-binding protein
LIEASNLKFAYNESRTFAYPDFQCKVDRPLLIKGRSGSGKTTLLHLLAGFLHPAAGSISVNNVSMTALSSRRLDRFRGRNIGIVFQRAHFMSALTVLDNILLAQYFSGQPLTPDKAVEMARRLHIGHLLKMRPSEISQGELQRVSLARALMHAPVVVLADEPTSSLDDENCARVIGLLAEQSYLAGSALIVVSHDERLKKHFSHTIELR